MQKLLLVILSAVIWFGSTLNPVFAQTYEVPSSKERDDALSAAKKFSSFLDNIKSNTITKKSNYWEVKVSKNNQKATIVVYKDADKKIVNVGITSPSVKIGNLISSADKGVLGDIQLKHVTMIIVSPNSPLKDKQGRVATGQTPTGVSTEVANLPAPIADSIKAANSKTKTILLPTGLYMLNQFQAGNNAFVNGVFKQVGLNNPVVSYASLNASNYKELKDGKAALSLSFLLSKKNPITRLLDQTRIVKTPKDAQPILILSTTTKRDSFGLKYISPYRVIGKGPYPTALGFKYSKKAKKGKRVSGELIVDIGNLKNPTIVPELIKLNDITMDDVKVSIGLTPGEKGLEVTAGFATTKMTVKGKNTYSPVRLQLAMTPAGPTGGLIDFKSKKTVDLAAIADLAEVAFRAHPSSKIVPSWAKKDISKKLQLNKLPKIGIKKPEIYLATPGQEKSSHLADLHDIAGAGVRVKGKLVVLDKELAKADLNLNAVDGLKSSASIKPFKAGPIALKNASFDLNAGPKTAPYFKVHGKTTFKDFTFSESELKFSKKGFKWVQDQGCVPTMMKVSIETKGFKPTKTSLKPSDCAEKIAMAVVEAGKVATEQVAKGTKKAAAGAAKASKKAAKWVNNAAKDVGNFAKKTGCKVKSFFGGSCKKKDKEKERKKRRKIALAKAKEYRKIEGPGHCGQGWYWNHKYRTCWQGSERKMLFYTFEGAKKGLCMHVKSKKEKAGLGVMLWECNARMQQQFRFIPMKKSKKSLIQTVRGFCLNANVSKSVVENAPITLQKCKNIASQRWQLVGSRIIGYKGLCLRSQLLSQSRSQLILKNCDSGPDIGLFKKKIASLKKQKKKVLKEYEDKIKPFKKATKFKFRVIVQVAKKERDKKIKKINKSIKAQKNNLNLAIEKERNPSKTPIEWVAVEPKNNAAHYYHAKFKAPSRATLSINGWCLESAGLLPKERMFLRKCNKKTKKQIFSIGIVKGNYFSLVSRHSRMCTDLFAYKKKDLAKIVTWPCNYSGNQQWLAVVGGQKTTSAKTFTHKTGFMIKSAHSGKCLAPFGVTKITRFGKKKIRQFGVKATDGAILVQMKCNPRDTNMRFKFTKR